MAEKKRRKYATVKEYAKVRRLQPQLVYYYIRTGKIDYKTCGCCGSKVIVINEADSIFRKEKDNV